MALRILHFADLHLDASFAWAGPAVGDRRRQSRRDVLKRIVGLAQEQHVDAISSGGDLFEHERVSPDTVAFLVRTLGDAGIPVYLAPGNHDPYVADSPYRHVLEHVPDVHVFRDPVFTPVELADGIRLWGVAHQATATLTDFFAGFRADGAAVHLALAHASERGARAWQGDSKVEYGPFDRSELVETGLALALLGHYHAPRDDRASGFVYPGNPDPLEFGEDGERGAVLVTIAGDGRVTWERQCVAVSVMHDIRVDVTGARDRDEVADSVRDAIAPLQGTVRVTLDGEVGPAVQIDPGALGELGPSLDGLAVRVGRITYPYDLEEIAAQQTVRGEFVREARAIADPDLRRRVILTGLRALDARTDLGVD